MKRTDAIAAESGRNQGIGTAALHRELSGAGCSHIYRQMRGIEVAEQAKLLVGIKLCQFSQASQ